MISRTSLLPHRSVLQLLLATVLGSLVLAGCSSSDPAADEPSATPSSPSASTSSVAEEKPEAPRLGACYDLSIRQAAQTASTEEPVPCTQRHTMKTLHVGKLGAEGKVRPNVENPAVRDRLTRTCNRELAQFVGGDPATRRLSRLQVVWFAPTQDELAQGADWVRCDVLAFSRSNDLMALPALKLRGVLDRPVGLDTFGLCGTAAPGDRAFERVACSLRHSWAAISTIPIAGGARYPGTAKVRAAGDEACKDQVNGRTSELKFEYGWEWPTADQWKAGQHYGFCWAPASLA